MIALAINIGSSSMKLALYDVDASLDEAAGQPPAPHWGASHAPPYDSLDALIAEAWTSENSPLSSASEIAVVGHRVVHGGTLSQSMRITDATRAEIARAGAFAPAHNAHELAAMAATTRLLGDSVPQVAVFDTAFHTTMPAPAYTYAGPHTWLELGIRRFGFHGINHRYVASRAATLMGRPLGELRIVTCHLGGGSSLAAVMAGRSVDTTMGFTPMDGLPMATRSGAIDPGILLYLLRQGATIDSLEEVLNRRSGLAGLSGLTGDMRELLASAHAGNARAELAIAVYVHCLSKGIAAMAASMGGLDALVFTGGVGEHAAEVRQRALDTLSFLGIELDAAVNARCTTDARVSSPGSRVAVLVVAAQENLVIAREAVSIAGHPGRADK